MANRQDKHAAAGGLVKGPVTGTIEASSIIVQPSGDAPSIVSAPMLRPGETFETIDPVMIGAPSMGEHPSVFGYEALLQQAQLEIEALQEGRRVDRETIMNLQANLEIESAHLGPELLSRDVAPDEIDVDPNETPGSDAYNAGLRSGMLAAALICETRWAGEIGNHCAQSIREAEEALP